MLLLGALTPHPPIILPEVGKEAIKDVEATRAAMKRLAEEIRSLQPDTVVIFSPHGPVFQDGMAIRGGDKLLGNLRRFGAPQTWQWNNDLELAEAIAREAVSEGVYTMVLGEDTTARLRIEPELDHGVLVPLSFLDKQDFSLVAMGMAMMPREDLYAFGKSVGMAIEKTGRRTVVIASGDLSHCLKQGAPSGYNPKGKELDQALVGLIRENRLNDLLSLDPGLVEQGAECGYRTILMLLGVMDGRRVETEVMSYEGPFGVGYAVARFLPGAVGTENSRLDALRKKQRDAVENRRNGESPLVKLARLTVESQVRKDPAPSAEDLPSVAKEQAGVFVSIKKRGELRGCIGTIEPVRKNVEAEIRANAVSAAFRDPRFEPVEEDELNDLVYSVDVLSPNESISGMDQLDPKQYGVIVRQGNKSGLLLPNLEGVDTVEEQVAIARRKAGISAGTEVELFRFKVDRYY